MTRCAVSAALLVLATAHAAEPSAAFLAAVRSSALAHPSAQAMARTSEAAEQDWQAARWQRFPSPSFQSGSPQAGGGQRVNRLLLEQPLYTGGRIEAGIEAAQQRLNASQHQYQQVVQDTAIKLVTTWYEWQRQTGRLAVQQEGVEAHRKLRLQIERRAQEGVSTEIDLALVTARLGQIQSEQSQTQSALSTSWEQLRQLAGEQLPALLNAGSSQQPAGLPQPEAQWLARSLVRDPQLARLVAEQAAANAEIHVKRGQLLPTLSVMVDRHVGGSNPDYRAWLQLNMQPGAGLSSVAAISAATARKESAEENRRSSELELRQALTADLASHQAAREQMGLASVLRQSTQDVADSYARQFVAGRKSWQEVLNAVREAMQARLTLADAAALMGQTAWRLQVRAFGLDVSPGQGS